MRAGPDPQRSAEWSRARGGTALGVLGARDEPRGAAGYAGLPPRDSESRRPTLLNWRIWGEPNQWRPARSTRIRDFASQLNAYFEPDGYSGSQGIQSPGGGTPGLQNQAPDAFVPY